MYNTKLKETYNKMVMKLLISLFFLIGLLFQQTFASEQYAFIKLLVNDRAITNIEIEIKAMEIAQAKRVDLSKTSVDQFRQEAIDILIEESLLDIKADEMKIYIRDDELDDELENFRKQRNISQADFEELLESQNMSLSDFQAVFRRQIRRNRVILRDVRAKINFDEEEIKKEYESGLDFEKLVRARHILFRLSAGAAEDDADKALAKANELKEKLKAGESFEKLADHYSEDPSVKRNHGDLGFFKKSDMVQEFSEAAFALEPGQISEPVRTQFGYHLIEVLEIKKQPKKSFEAAKTELLNEKFRKEYTKLYSQYIKDLKSKAKIVFK